MQQPRAVADKEDSSAHSRSRSVLKGCCCLCLPRKRRPPSPSPPPPTNAAMVQMFYYENRGKCCKKLLKYNGYPNKVSMHEGNVNKSKPIKISFPSKHSCKIWKGGSVGDVERTGMSIGMCIGEKSKPITSMFDLHSCWMDPFPLSKRQRGKRNPFSHYFNCHSIMRI